MTFEELENKIHEAKTELSLLIGERQKRIDNVTLPIKTVMEIYRKTSGEMEFERYIIEHYGHLL